MCQVKSSEFVDGISGCNDANISSVRRLCVIFLILLDNDKIVAHG